MAQPEDPLVWSTRTPKEVIANVCGKEVSAEPLIRYFKEKYSKLYDLNV